jgi:hypothetical protein
MLRIGVFAALMESGGSRRTPKRGRNTGLFLFQAAFERQFGDAGFVEFAEAEFHHFVILFFGGFGEREL